MRMFISILLTVFVAGVATFSLPWWMVSVVSFLVSALIQQKPGRSFLTGFLAIAILWLGYALYKDIPNQHILSARMAQLFSLPGYGLYILILVLIGGLVGGISAWSGALLSRVFKR